MTDSVHVRAPCRLHFGMFSFGHSDGPQYGGVGAMVDLPCVEVSFTPADQFSIQGSLRERALGFVELAAKKWQLETLPGCSVDVQSPPDHTGLGVGTQLGLAIATGLRQILQLPGLTVEALAKSVGRGKRSAVGTYGFEQGGLIVDAGKNSGEPLGKLSRRVALPASWRFVLIRPTDGQGLAGVCEADAFARLPPVPDYVTRELWRLTNEQTLPALERADCAAFGEAVHRFGRLAGECFAAAQGGPFASRQIARLIESIQEFGVAGVGQSSWGPTVFAIAANLGEAEKLAGWLRDQHGGRCEIVVAPPNSSGATIRSQASFSKTRYASRRDAAT